MRAAVACLPARQLCSPLEHARVPDDALEAARAGVVLVKLSSPVGIAAARQALDLAPGGVPNYGDRALERGPGPVLHFCRCWVCCGTDTLRYSRAFLRCAFEDQDMMSVTLPTAHNPNDHLQWFACMCGAIAANLEGLRLDVGGVEVHRGFRAGGRDCSGPFSDREAVRGKSDLMVKR